MLEKRLQIHGASHWIAGDADYLGRMGDTFEPFTGALLSGLCDVDSQVFDIGANIGLTALALAQACPIGQVLAFEPVPQTFAYLQRNIAQAGMLRVRALNLAVGAAVGSVSMYVDERNLATSFVVDIDSGNGQAIPLVSLDHLRRSGELPAPQVIKIDVEGCELEVLEGARELLAACRPRVMLEMNHWCLNVFRRISLPQFRDALLALFPVVYAVDEQGYLDFADPLNAGHIYHEHVFANRYMNIVAGFERDDLRQRLDAICGPASSAPASVLTALSA